MEIKLIDNCFC